MKILKRTTCRPILPSSPSKLTYEIGYSPAKKNFHIRLTGNTGGGHFSAEWIGIVDVLKRIGDVPEGQPFKAILFQSLYEGRSANNAGFLAACLRNEGILVTPGKAVYSHLPGDTDGFFSKMRKLASANTDLPDTFGEALAARLDAVKQQK